MTFSDFSCISFASYIKPQRKRVMFVSISSCISFASYIKPQQIKVSIEILKVVYLSLPTSNHNCLHMVFLVLMLYIFRFLHQTTTYNSGAPAARWLYIFRFLHQTTTRRATGRTLSGCISFASYIKPQLLNIIVHGHLVVYLSLPTSNHNL